MHILGGSIKGPAGGYAEVRTMYRGTGGRPNDRRSEKGPDELLRRDKDKTTFTKEDVYNEIIGVHGIPTTVQHGMQAVMSCGFQRRRTLS